MTTEQKHTPGPWGVEKTRKDVYIGPLRPDGKISYIVCAVEWCEDFKDSAKVQHIEDARRIVACVNALQGIGTETLERYVAGGGKIMIHRFVDLEKERDALAAKLAVVTAQWDELLATLNRFAAYPITRADELSAESMRKLSAELITKIEAEKAKTSG